MVNQLPMNDHSAGLIEIRKDENVSFAHYYQPASKLQFAYNVEWKAIKTNGRAVLLLSRKGLYCKPFDENENSTWKDSSLRAWLNGEFLRSCFSHGNEVMPVPTSCDYPLQVESLLPYRLPEHDGFRGKSLDQDYVFLLSEEEFDLLLPEDRQIIAHWIEDESQIEDPHYINWWLRSDSALQGKCVDADGQVVSCACNSEDVFVRPAVWIDNFFIKRSIMDVNSGWNKLVIDARNNCFDYAFFKRIASQTFDILYLFRNPSELVPAYPKVIVEILMLISRFSEINLQDENDQHRLAKNAAESFCVYSTHWQTIYKYKPKPGEPGALTHALIMAGLNGDSIVVNTRDFDMEHPLDNERLAQEGYYTF